MALPDTTKPVYCRLELPVHAQLSAVAELEGIPVSQAAQAAIVDYLRRKTADGSLKAAAEKARTKIQQEAYQQLHALDGVLAGMESVTPAKGGESKGKG
jgi:hypothetical protein